MNNRWNYTTEQLMTMEPQELDVVLRKFFKYMIPSSISTLEEAQKAGQLLGQYTSYYVYLNQMTITARLRKRRYKQEHGGKFDIMDALSREELFEVHATSAKQAWDAISRMLTVKHDIDEEIKFTDGQLDDLNREQILPKLKHWDYTMQEILKMEPEDLNELLAEAFEFPIMNGVISIDDAKMAGECLGRYAKFAIYLNQMTISARIQKRELQKSGAFPADIENALSKEEIFNAYASNAKEAWASISRMVTIKHESNREMKLSDSKSFK